MADRIEDAATEYVEPTRRAFRAAVQMEIHAACSSTTRAKAAALDEAFPAYADILNALRLALVYIEFDERAQGCVFEAGTDARAAIAKADAMLAAGESRYA